MHHTAPEAETSYVVNVTSSQDKALVLKVGCMCVTMHGIYHLPVKLSQLHIEHDVIEVVFKPTAKYYYEDQRVTVMELPEHCISALPSMVKRLSKFGNSNNNSNSINNNSNDSVEEYAIEFDEREDNLLCSMDHGKSVSDVNMCCNLESEINGLTIQETSQLLNSSSNSNVTINTYNTKNNNNSNSDSSSKRLPPLKNKTNNFNNNIAVHQTLQPEIHIDHDNESDYNSPISLASPIPLTSTSSSSMPSSAKTIKSKNEPISQEAFGNAKSVKSIVQNGNRQNVNSKYCSEPEEYEQQPEEEEEEEEEEEGSEEYEEQLLLEQSSESLLSSQIRQERQLALHPQLKPYQFYVYFPSRLDLKVIIEIFVGVRHRRRNSSAMRWLTSPIESLNFSTGLNSANGANNNTNNNTTNTSNNKNNDIASFAAAEGEVMHHKSVNRLIGLTIGHVLCSMSLPHIYEDLSCKPIQIKGSNMKRSSRSNKLSEQSRQLRSSQLINAAIVRLLRDEEEHIRFCSFLPSVDASSSRVYLTELELRKRLTHGQSE